MKTTSSGRSLLTDVLLGAAAGAAATWVMDRVTTVMYDREDPEAREREDAARGGKTAYAIAAEKGARLVGVTLDDDREKQIGSAIHWALGTAAGAGYGITRNRLPHVGLGSGLAWGLLVWLTMDEGALTLFGLTPPPREFPWQTHARGLVGHLVLGAVIEAAFDAADAVS